MFCVCVYIYMQIYLIIKRDIHFDFRNQHCFHPGQVYQIYKIQNHHKYKMILRLLDLTYLLVPCSLPFSINCEYIHSPNAPISFLNLFIIYNAVEANNLY